MRWEPPVAVGLTAGAVAELAAHHVHSPVLIASGVVGAAVLGARGWARFAAPAVSLVAFCVPVIVIGHQVPMLGAGPTSISLALALLFAVFLIGTCSPPRLAISGLGLVLVLCALYAYGPGAPPGSSANDQIAAFLFSGIVPWLAGFAVGWQQRAHAADLLLQQARTTAAAERSRIAREVHDLVAHTVSVMVVQAEAAEALLATQPDRSIESLHAVQQAGRDALGAMRRTVAALRAGDVNRCAAGLDDLPGLLDTVRSAGLPVTVATDGTPAALNATIDQTAYRVIQEALTNSLRHTDHRGALVRLDHRPDALTITVLDEGRPHPRQLPGGHGLAGLRERIATAGGTLDAGPTAEGNFLVHAVLPTIATT